MRGLNVRSMLIATAVGVICGPLAGLAAPSPPSEEKGQKVVTTATNLQDKEVYKFVETIRDKAETIVLKADKVGKLIEVRVRPVDVTKNEYVISADSISISDVAGKKMGNLVLTAEGNVAFTVTGAEKAPSVRIGVVTEALSKALAGHLKIRPDQALIVTGVMEGLPAANAGIRRPVNQWFWFWGMSFPGKLPQARNPAPKPRCWPEKASSRTRAALRLSGPW